MLVLAGIVLLITSPFLMMLGLMLLYAGLALMWYLRRKRRRA
jgi:hypothetical protein